MYLNIFTCGYLDSVFSSFRFHYFLWTLVAKSGWHVLSPISKMNSFFSNVTLHVQFWIFICSSLYTCVNISVNCVLIDVNTISICVAQWCKKCGPRAKCGPRRHELWPAKGAQISIVMRPAKLRSAAPRGSRVAFLLRPAGRTENCLICTPPRSRVTHERKKVTYEAWKTERSRGCDAGCVPPGFLEAKMWPAAEKVLTPLI